MHLFSGKISNSFICYFQKEGKDIYPLLKEVKVSEELLCNPDCWIDSEIIEKLLSQACFLFKDQGEKDFYSLTEESLLEKVGHETPTLKAWGALDWALRMIEDPWETFQNPEMFLSYFISPKPKIHQLQYNEKGISFYLPFQEKDYPCISTYLKAAIASLPCYRDKNRASVKWQGYKLTIERVPQELPLFTSQSKYHHFNPSVISSIFENLQQTQKYLYQLQQNQKSSPLYGEREKHFPIIEEKRTSKSHEIVQNSLYFFKDYISRKKIKFYQNALLCDQKSMIHFPQQIQICFHLFFSLILSFIEEEETIYVHHSDLEQKGMEIKINFKKKISKENLFLSTIEATQPLLVFLLKKEGAHMKLEVKKSNYSFSFYLPLHKKEHWTN